MGGYQLGLPPNPVPSREGIKQSSFIIGWLPAGGRRGKAWFREEHRVAKWWSRIFVGLVAQRGDPVHQPSGSADDQLADDPASPPEGSRCGKCTLTRRFRRTDSVF